MWKDLVARGCAMNKLSDYKFSGDPVEFAGKTVTWLRLIGFPDAALQLGMIVSENR